MSSVSISKGWMIWGKALFHPRSIGRAAEWMFRLNVFARHVGRHAIVDQIYALKNDLIRYLYQNGYATEVLLHKQKRICYACDGTGEYWTGAECFKCDGTGIFSVTELYALRFLVDGKVYKWHQLKKLVDYPIELTDPNDYPFVAPSERDDVLPAMDEAWLGCCIVWWTLLTHGIVSHLQIFSATRDRIVRWAFALRMRWSSLWDRDEIPF